MVEWCATVQYTIVPFLKKHVVVIVSKYSNCISSLQVENCEFACPQGGALYRHTPWLYCP